VRHEAHLSRQLYQALHELEAAQARRKGQGSPPGSGRRPWISGGSLRVQRQRDRTVRPTRVRPKIQNKFRAACRDRSVPNHRAPRGPSRGGSSS
jgi:hypothetical protein